QSCAKDRRRGNRQIPNHGNSHSFCRGLPWALSRRTPIRPITQFRQVTRCLRSSNLLASLRPSSPSELVDQPRRLTRSLRARAPSPQRPRYNSSVFSESRQVSGITLNRTIGRLWRGQQKESVSNDRSSGCKTFQLPLWLE